MSACSMSNRMERTFLRVSSSLQLVVDIGGEVGSRRELARPNWGENGGTANRKKLRQFFTFALNNSSLAKKLANKPGTSPSPADLFHKI